MAGAGEGKTAFITGAGSGIGRATAEVFLKAGYSVALVDRDEATGKQAEDELKAVGNCRFVQCDVSVAASFEAAVKKKVETFGGLHAAFNAAGIEGEKANMTADCTLENWDAVLRIDLTGTFYCMKYQIKAMLESGGGNIVNCASVAGILGAATFAAYVAAKHGVVGLTKTAALEYARQGIRVNAICPGTINTRMNQELDPDLLNMILNASPMGRLGTPEGIGEAALWLCGDGAEFLTGQAIPIDGGWSTQ